MDFNNDVSGYDDLGLDTSVDVEANGLDITDTASVELAADAPLDITDTPPDDGTTDILPQDVSDDSNGRIVENLRGIEGLNQDDWPSFDTSERLGILQEVENTIAEGQGRPSVDLSVDDDAPVGLFGGYDPQTDQITLSGWHIRDNDVHEIVDTVAHEGRHAYQFHAMEHPEIHPDPDEVRAWQENAEFYYDADTFGQELYMSQPLEADAWENGSAIADRLFDRA